MNCKPDQMAWIVVPRHYQGTGMEQLDRRVVRTIALLPGYAEPVWSVTPKQIVKFSLGGVDHKGHVIQPGDILQAEGIPDSMLRPFDPRSAPAAIHGGRELEEQA